VLGEPPDEVVLAVPHTVLKTSSGKIRRAATRAAYESGRHRPAQQTAMWLQLLHLSLGTIRPITERGLRRLRDLSYGTYFWAVFALLGSVTFLIALLPLRAGLIWSFAHRMARLFLGMTFVPFDVQGREQLREAVGRIVVVNHSSYLDGLFLLATLPHPCHLVAKRELARLPVVGTLLRRMGAVFVERFDVRAGVEDAHRLATLAGKGESCIFFPEGTFTRVPGLMAFHLGAFAAAVETGLPIVPIALRGTRALLPDEQWLPRRAPIVVHIGQPIMATPARNAFATTTRLRDAARHAILEHCGEPDLVGTATDAEEHSPMNIERRSAR
jgi:1-acyl-sn-glycerol-3-phosphate acyltransferase